MSVTYGFYNSSNGDRKYSARQISSIFDGIINDGIYQNYGHHFQVNDARLVDGTNGMFVYVDTGRAWLDHTWTLNDAPLKVNIDAADLSNPRIDTIVIEVDESTRTNSIKAVKGTPSASPVAPTLINNATKHQHALADVRVGTGVISIGLLNITNRIGFSTGTPWVIGLFETMSADSIYAQWQAQWEEWLAGISDEAGGILANFNNLRIFGNSSSLALFPKTAGTTKNYSQTSPIHYSPIHDFTNDFYPNTNIKVGDYLVDAAGYIAKLTYKTGYGDNSKIYYFTVESTGFTIATFNGANRVFYYISQAYSAELPNVLGESKWLTSQDMDGIRPSGRVIEGDILIGDTGSVCRVLSNPYEWDAQLQDYMTCVICISSLDTSPTEAYFDDTTLVIGSAPAARNN